MCTRQRYFVIAKNTRMIWVNLLDGPRERYIAVAKRARLRRLMRDLNVLDGRMF